MPVDMATVGVLGGLILPVYAALWQMNRVMGRTAKATEHNETALEDLSTQVSRIETAVVESHEDVTPSDVRA